jgi:hypothetical protein
LFAYCSMMRQVEGSNSSSTQRIDRYPVGAPSLGQGPCPGHG